MKLRLLLKNTVKAVTPYGLLRFIEDSNFSIYLRSKFIFKKYYIPKYGKVKRPVKHGESIKKIIYIADGRLYAGGLTDRITGIVSLYKMAKELKVDFKISMTSPVNLTNYLIPNKYNWIINEDEIIHNTKESVIYNFWLKGYARPVEKLKTLKTIRSLFRKWNQVHITTNTDFANREYGELFDELFKPTDELKNKIDYSLREIGCDFISVTFRFQQLLGDFIEKNGDYPILPDTQKASLTDRCIERLSEIYRENNYKKILVTSDSITFLNKAKEFEFVYVIPGEIAHIDYQTTLEKEVYMKSFLDYFMLTHSKLVYQVIEGQMYNSGFPYRAALHNFPYKIKQ